MNGLAAVLAAFTAALSWAVHVSIPAMGLPAPVPVLLAFAAVIGTLAFMIAGTVAQDGLFPCWQRGAGA